ncbi:MAG: acetyl-CoA carboxylase carboxyltransferase subunit, partial [Myxococcales bacterium]|nr:acetyl-CoA carboxylase carboxyltransferase subunit [Polyangiaceae bacterium]MDW8251510.1 acetyl-CoA carboxylase carboxyltransferase subunit [Myxococcales bacterium]
MGPAGKEFVYKDELRKLRGSVAARVEAGVRERVAAGATPEAAKADATAEAQAWLKAREAELSQRYERELMNPREALSLGSISSLVMPSELRQALASNMLRFLRHYTPRPFLDVQREFH